MKIVFSFCLLWICLHSAGQKIRYSKEHVRAAFPDAVQLVPNIAGHHHLICFDANSKPAFYIFDSELKWLGKNELDFKLKVDADVQVIPFKNFYFLYVHQSRTNNHEIWKITAKGDAENYSEQFKLIMDSAMRASQLTFQFFNRNENLYAVSNVYYRGIKSIVSSVIQLDGDVKIVADKKVQFPFNSEEERIQQVVLANDGLLVSKTKRSYETGNSLEILKVPFDTLDMLAINFNSGRNSFVRPQFNYNPADSSILVYTSFYERDNAYRIQTTTFISKLNYLLQQNASAYSYKLKQTAAGNGLSNFFLVEGKEKAWVGLQSIMPIISNRFGTQRVMTNGYSSAPGIIQRQYYGSSYGSNIDISGSIHFTVLDTLLKKKKDSTMPYQGKKQQIIPASFASFRFGNKAFLLMEQKFAKKYNGLLLVEADEQGNILTNDLPVYDQYEFILSQLKQVNDRYVILPYIYKKEIGLVKVEMD